MHQQANSASNPENEVVVPESAPKRGKPSKKLVAILAAGALVLAGGVTAVAVSIAKSEAEETARQCTVALEKGTAAAAARTSAIEAAELAVTSTESTALPGDEGWTSTAYAERPGAAAVEAVPVVEASEGVEAVPAVEEAPERPSGAETLASVTDARDRLAGAKIDAECAQRDEAAAITAQAKDVTAAAVTLETETAALLADFEAFQAEEKTRIAAEIEAARIAAEAEAARIAAEAEAARIAAEQAAAAQRAAARAPVRQSTGGGSTGGRAPAPAPAPAPPRGGGGIGPGGNPDVCWTSNGMGGLVRC